MTYAYWWFSGLYIFDSSSISWIIFRGSSANSKSSSPSETEFYTSWIIALILKSGLAFGLWSYSDTDSSTNSNRFFEYTTIDFYWISGTWASLLNSGVFFCFIFDLPDSRGLDSRDFCLIFFKIRFWRFKQLATCLEESGLSFWFQPTREILLLLLN